MLNSIWQFKPNPLSIVLFAFGVLLMVIAAGMAQRSERRLPGQRALVLVLAAQAIWMGGYAAQLAEITTEGVLVAQSFKFIGLLTVPVFTVWFLMDYTGENAPTWVRWSLLLLPALTWAVIVTNGQHGWFWTSWSADSTGLYTVFRATYGWWYFVQIGYTLLIAVQALLMVWRGARQAYGGVRAQYRRLLALGGLAFVAMLLDVSGFSQVSGIEFTPVMLAVTGLAVVFMLRRRQLFDLVPAARSRVLDSISDGVLVLDVQRHIVDINQAGALLCALPQEELVGQDLSAAVPHLAQLFEQALMQTDLAMATVAGFSIEINVSALHDKGGAVAGYVVVMRDITSRLEAQRRVRRSESRHSALLNSIQLPVVAFDSDMTILYCNEAYADAIGQPLHRLAGCSMVEMIPGMLGSPLYQLAQQVLATGTPDRFEHQIGDRFLNVTLFPTPLGLLSIGEDITAQKRTEAAMRGYAAELEARNTDLDDFGHMVAHDLRAPLTMINGYAVLLADEPGLSADGHDYIHEIQKASENMNGIIKSLLLLARLRDADQVLGPVPLTPCVEASLERFGAALQERAFRLEIAPDMPAVHAHSPWLEEVIANLVGNAVKYIGPDNPAPWIAVRAERLDGGKRVRCIVEDNGVGIAPADQARLFQAFERADATSHIDGFGLGLSIVLRILEKLGGQAGVESTPGEGSRFYFDLPAAEQRALEASSAEAAVVPPQAVNNSASPAVLQQA